MSNGVFMSESILIMAFWDMTPSSLVERCTHFGRNWAVSIFRIVHVLTHMVHISEDPNWNKTYGLLDVMVFIHVIIRCAMLM
jgi:hypothetical protein